MNVKFQNRILKRVQNDIIVMPNLFGISFEFGI
jgi:hypothetical protein